jgi:hypothetical protein
MDLECPGFLRRKAQVVFSDDPLLSDPYWQNWVKEQDQPVVSVTADSNVQHANLELVLRRASTP